LGNYSLNRVREARLQIGGLTLIEASMVPPTAKTGQSSVVGRVPARDLPRGRGSGHTSSDEENARYLNDGGGVEGCRYQFHLIHPYRYNLYR